MKRVWVQAMAIWLLLAGSGSAGDARATRLAEMLLAESKAPGVAVAYLDKSVSGRAVAGLRTIKHDVPVQIDDLWHVGSITKSMTSTLVARLATQGKIVWRDSVGEVLGDIVPVDPGYTDVTYRQLLSHRAGLRANMGPLQGLGFLGDWQSRDLVADRMKIAEIALKRPPEHPPGSEFLYSNLGYVVAGAMIETSTGESWETLVQREVFAPMGISSAGFGAPGQAKELNSPWGHSRGFFGKWVAAPPSGYADNPPAFGPAGTVHMTVTDLLKYAEMHLNELSDFLSPEVWHLLHVPQKGQDYAAGWGVGQGQLGHDGSNTMWYARIALWPDADRALVLLANAADDAMPAAFNAVTRAFSQGE